jgi:membrane protease YdiL (CAAX protease family)
MKNNISTWIKRNSLILYFFITYLITWTIWVPIVAGAQGWMIWNVPFALYYLGSFGPMLAAIIITALTEGSRGLRHLFSGLFKWRVGFGYFAFSVFGPFVLLVIARIASRLMTGVWPDLSLLGKADYFPYLGIPAVMVLWLLTYGLGEELGWRGFALPHMQNKMSARTASVILAVFWALWHLPAFFFRDTYQALGLLGFPLFLINMIFASIILTWLYNGTGGSLLMVIIFHALFDWLSVSDAGGQYAAMIMGATAIAWAVFVMIRYGAANLSPVEKQVWQPGGEK